MSPNPKRLKNRLTSSTSRDPCTTYARNVTAGKIIAGPPVRAACQRHLTDLEQAPQRGFFFDTKLAARAIGFYKDVLRLNGGQFEGLPYQLLPWQQFIVGSIFGWVKADGTRRFSSVYVETAKGTGKSPLAAGIGLYCLMCDGEPRAEIYAAATKKDQAMILFRDAIAMYRQSPELQTRLVSSGSLGNEWNLAYHETGSFFRPISSDDGASGPRPHCSLIDELHEHRDGYVLSMLEAGQKGRRQALTFMITNSGKQKAGVCWDYHQHGVRVSSGIVEDDTFFAYICANDLAEDGKTEIDPFEHPEEWIKTNPSLGVTLQTDYLEKQIRQARGLPSLEATVRRLNFCQWGWGANATPWIGFDLWMNAGNDYHLSDFAGRKAYLGLDLSAVRDLTAAVFVIQPETPGEPWHIAPYFWLPGEGLLLREEKENIPWSTWAKSGHLFTCPGAVVDYAQVGQWLWEVSQTLDVQAAGRDPWMKSGCQKAWDDAGIAFPFEFEDFGQGYKSMSPAIKELERRLIGGMAVHPNHPILNLCAANAQVARDPADNVKFTKSNSLGRIDGLVALAIATGMSLDAPEPLQPGLFFL